MKTAKQLFDEGSTLEQIQSFSSHHVNARDIRTYLIGKSKWAALISVPMTDPLFNATDGLRLAAEENRTITLNPDTTQGAKHLEMLTSFKAASKIDVTNETDIKAMAAATKPYASFSEVQYKAFQNPPVRRVVTIASGQEHLVLPNNGVRNLADTGGFKFAVTPTEDFFGTVTIHVKAKKEGETEYAPFPQRPYQITGHFKAGVTEKHAFPRGYTVKGEKNFQFEFDEPYANAVASIEAESIF